MTSRSTARIRPELRQKAFPRLGGAARFAVLDNLSASAILASYVNRAFDLTRSSC